MKKEKIISILFITAALYDGLLGILFLFASDRLFEYFQMTPPNHLGYVQFPAALLMIFAIMFYMIARKPLANKNLIPYGILLKVSYCSVVFFHWFATGIPNMWKPFAIFDLAFLGLFIWAYTSLRGMMQREKQGQPL
jgi:hypothetical protein